MRKTGRFSTDEILFTFQHPGVPSEGLLKMQKKPARTPLRRLNRPARGDGIDDGCARPPTCLRAVREAVGAAEDNFLFRAESPSKSVIFVLHP